MKNNDNNNKKITYQKLFWLYMIGNVLGCILEGIWCIFKYGAWETHVVSMIGPFCLIYGVGFVLLYSLAKFLKDKNIIIQFLGAVVILDFVEYACGFMLEHALGMRAWNYSRYFMNLNGYISLSMSIIWGILGLLFIYWLMPLWDKIYSKYSNRLLNYTCYILSIIMALDLIFTTMCIFRWSERHNLEQPSNIVEKYIDKKYPDEFMQKRFIEWRFIKR